MDAIGSSTKLMWFFVFIYSFPILLLILSVAIWSYKKFKRFAFISYIADTTLTVLILLGDISNLVSRFIKGTPMYLLNLWNLFFLILSVIFIIISIGSCCKNHDHQRVVMICSKKLNRKFIARKGYVHGRKNTG